MSAQYLKVSQLARLLNDTLEMYVGESFFEGELQEITRASSGHLYCTIKDDISSLSIVLWATTVRQLKFKPEKGILVRCQGKANVYSKTGRLQIVVSKMEPAGEGALQQKFEELRKKLEAEGLFAEQRKRKIPFLPKGIGIISSKQGAALHDIMVRLKERMPHIPVFLVDVRVQGDGSAQEIAAALKFLGERSDLIDVIICGRGGGSLQDLWSFNEEIVVRAIFSCKLPVISAVGHEVDLTLADLVADVRAPTPTAAAEIVVPKRQDLQRILNELQRRLDDYPRWLMPKVQELDETYRALEYSVLKLINGARLKFEVAFGKLKLLSPDNLIKLELSKLAKIETRILNAMHFSLEKSKTKLDQIITKLSTSSIRQFDGKKNLVNRLSSQLEALNPSSVLQRGYSIARKKNSVITSSKDVVIGDALELEFKDGRLSTEVKKI